MDDPLIVHVLQPAGDSQGLASKMKIKEIMVKCEKSEPAPVCWSWGSCEDIP